MGLLMYQCFFFAGGSGASSYLRRLLFSLMPLPDDLGFYSLFLLGIPSMNWTLLLVEGTTLFWLKGFVS